MPRGGWTGGKRAVDLKLEDINREYVNKDASLQDAAKILQCSRKILTAALQMHGIPTKPKARKIGHGRPLEHFELANHGWLKAQIETRSLNSIARELGMSTSSVRGYVIRHGLYEKYPTVSEGHVAGWRKSEQTHQKFDKLNKDEIIRVYKETDLTIDEACRELNCSLPTLVKAMRHFGIEPKSRGRTRQRWTPNAEDFPELDNRSWLELALETKTIQEIAKELDTTAWNVNYHVEKYGLQALARIIFTPTLNVSTLRRRRDRGYRKVFVPLHPSCDRDGFIFEHRVVLENKLGRYLNPDEVAHHLNEKKWDNRPENLVEMTRFEHARHHFQEGKRKAEEESESLREEIHILRSKMIALQSRRRRVDDEIKHLDQLDMFNEPED